MNKKHSLVNGNPQSPLLQRPLELESDRISLLHALPATRFIEEIYRQLLGREPDSAGRKHYTAQLYSGASRFAIMYELIDSSEFKRAGTRDPEFEREIRLRSKAHRGWRMKFRRVLGIEAEVAEVRGILCKVLDQPGVPVDRSQRVEE
jgi:hypothetical protein